MNKEGNFVTEYRTFNKQQGKSQPHKRQKQKNAIISWLFLVSGVCFFQLPAQRIYSITVILNKHKCSMGKALQIVRFGVSGTLADNAKQQPAGQLTSHPKSALQRPLNNQISGFTHYRAKKLN
ncbi:hypothetical protein JFU49_25190 [Pseudomonas sp. TH03]|uniref:hypothetical protein n=1 Tax=Pseudomonas sp. TH03 TaxID=2796369 RepID=UPI001914AE5A|nr:hypothetical protein [Pseudomonas sp. TH03]MBK5553554.1 hypothetical protein [Pseudomonas sp. TH03]